MPENYDDLSIDQLAELKAEIKAKFREEYEAIDAVYKRKVAEWHEDNLQRTAGLPGVMVEPGPIGS